MPLIGYARRVPAGGGRIAPAGARRGAAMSERYRRWWFPDDGHHQAGLFEEVGRVVPDSGRVLDLGCGANDLLARFRTPEREVWGADLQRHPELAHPKWFRLM